MTETIVKINGVSVKKVTLNTAIIGSGAAGYNAALRKLQPFLFDFTWQN